MVVIICKSNIIFYCNNIMDIKDFARQVKAKRGELDTLMRRNLPVIAGRMAKDHFQDNFRKGGFVNNGLEKWKPTRRQGVAAGAAGKYGPLLSSRDNLYRSLVYRPSVRKVTISTPVSYAAVHNDGGTVHPTVTPKMRKFAWRKYYEAGGGNSGQEDPPQATPWKQLALTKKQKLSINIPQRKFIGASAELEKKINRLLQSHVDKILKR